MGFSRYSPDRKYPSLSDEQKVELFKPKEEHTTNEPRRKPVVHNIDMYNTNITPKSRKGYT